MKHWFSWSSGFPPDNWFCVWFPLQDLWMHGGWGRDNSAAEERAQRKGIKINRYSTGSPQLCSSSWPDPGSYEPDAGQCWRTFHEQRREMKNTISLPLLVIIKTNLPFKPTVETHSVYSIFAPHFLTLNGEFCQSQAWKWEYWLASHTQGPFKTLVPVIGFTWELSLLRNYYKPRVFTFPWFIFVLAFLPSFEIWLSIAFTYFLLRKKKVMRKLQKFNTSFLNMKVKVM